MFLQTNLKRIAILFSIQALFTVPAFAQARVIWAIGRSNNNAAEFALAPAGHDKFLERDFGWEDRYFLVGHSQAEKDWPYIMPGPADNWGGTSGTAGRRTHVLNILFALQQAPASDNWKLIVDLLDTHTQDPPLLKVTVNGHSTKFSLPRGGSDASATGDTRSSTEHVVEIPIKRGVIRQGGNEISLAILAGSWMRFDQVRLEGPKGVIEAPIRNVFIRDVRVADYETADAGRRAQPLLIDIEHIGREPELSVRIDGNRIFTATVEQGRYRFEAPMPAVSAPTDSRYEILVDGDVLEKGKVRRRRQRLITPAEYVDTRIGTSPSTRISYWLVGGAETAGIGTSNR